MADNTIKDDLRYYLQTGRDVLLCKLDGLSEYDVRRPLVDTGPNLPRSLLELAHAGT